MKRVIGVNFLQEQPWEVGEGLDIGDVVVNKEELDAVIEFFKSDFESMDKLNLFLDNRELRRLGWKTPMGIEMVELPGNEGLVAKLKKENEELRKELDLTDKLLDKYREAIKTVPECSVHGDDCIPHALEWTKRMKSVPDGLIESFEDIENKFMFGDKIPEMEPKISPEKSIMFLLESEYMREWEVIDGLHQHQDGLTFSGWLEKHKLLDDNKY